MMTDDSYLKKKKKKSDVDDGVDIGNNSSAGAPLCNSAPLVATSSEPLTQAEARKSLLVKASSGKNDWISPTIMVSENGGRGDDSGDGEDRKDDGGALAVPARLNFENGDGDIDDVRMIERDDDDEGEGGGRSLGRRVLGRPVLGQRVLGRRMLGSMFGSKENDQASEDDNSVASFDTFGDDDSICSEDDDDDTRDMPLPGGGGTFQVSFGDKDDDSRMPNDDEHDRNDEMNDADEDEDEEEVLHMDLESAEAKALKDYTDEGYRQINSAHRTGDVSEEIEEKTALIKAALSLIPPYDGIAYRGDSYDVWKRYDIGVGKVFSDPGFLSTSTDKVAAEDFAMESNAKAGFDGTLGVMIEIFSCNGGRYIAPYAVEDHQHEEEVLFPPGTKFRIEKVERDDAEKTGRVVMKEIVEEENTSVEDDNTVAVPVEDEETVAAPVPIQSSTEDDSSARQRQLSGDPVNLDGMGSQWIDGRRRSARLQPRLGSVYVGGLRRSARLM